MTELSSQNKPPAMDVPVETVQRAVRCLTGARTLHDLREVKRFLDEERVPLDHPLLRTAVERFYRDQFDLSFRISWNAEAQFESASDAADTLNDRLQFAAHNFHPRISDGYTTRIRAFNQKCGEIALKLLSQGRFYDSRRFWARPPEDLAAYDLPLFYASFAQKWGCSTFSDLCAHAIRESVLIRQIAKTPDEAVLITREEAEACAKAQIYPSEAEVLKRSDVAIDSILGADADASVRLLTDRNVWGDDFTREQCLEGSRLFGAAKFLRYSWRTELSRPEILHGFPAVLELFRQSGLSAPIFFNNILDQTARDSADYLSGSAHHELNRLARAVPLREIVEGASIAAPQSGIEWLAEVGRRFDTPEKVCASWRTFRNACEFLSMLRSEQLVRRLGELQGTEREFYRTLLEDPSRINLAPVAQMLFAPQQFFEARDLELSELVSQHQHPLNLCAQPHLPLTPAMLSKEIAGGGLASKAALPPYAITYRIPKRCVDAESLADEIKSAVRQLKQGNEREARRLFSEIRRIFGEHGTALDEYLRTPVPLPGDLERTVRAVLPAGRTPAETYLVRVEIHAKGDPYAARVPIATGSCNQPGSEKWAIYELLSTAAFLSINRPDDDGELRPVAHSVLSLDYDHGPSGRPFESREGFVERNDLRSYLETDGSILADHLPDSPRYVLTGDNLEVNKNHRQGVSAQLQEMAVRDFVTRYLEELKGIYEIRGSEMLIGSRYSTTLTHLGTRPRQTLPVTWLGYTDRENADLVLPADRNSLLPEEWIEVEPRGVPGEPRVSGGFARPAPGIHSLGVIDTLPVASLHLHAFKDTPELLDTPLEIQTLLQAAEIWSSASGAPELSLMERGKGGELRGYLIAYEGRFDPESDETTSIELPPGSAVLYIADFATRDHSGRTALRLINRFVETVQSAYLHKEVAGKVPPILIEARPSMAKFLSSTLERLLTRRYPELTIEINDWAIPDDARRQYLITVGSRGASEAVTAALGSSR